MGTSKSEERVQTEAERKRAEDDFRGNEPPPLTVQSLPQAAGGWVVAATFPDPGSTDFITSTSKVLPELRDEYQYFFDNCVVKDARKADVAGAVANVTAGRARYQATSTRLGGSIPWFFIGITHLLEGQCDFTTHLHNGDPMFRDNAGARTWLKTVQKPNDHPAVWPAPQGETDPWIWSAMDALRVGGLDKATDWSVPAMLFHFEGYNGYGYRQFRNPTPYLWSLSQIFQRGKYDRDSHYDPNALSDQCGAGLVLQALMQQNPGT
jgi:lysozyme family protein